MPVLGGLVTEGAAAATQPLKQWTRVTMHVDEEGQLPSLMGTNAVFASYDLVAVRITADSASAANKIFAKCCSNLDVDIISIDLSSRLPFHLRPQLVTKAIERGIHFEITYAAALRDSTARRILISNALLLVRATRGRNLLLASEARRAIDLRSAHDVANLGTLFGLDPSTARACLSQNVRAVTAHGAARRLHGAIVPSQSTSPIDQPKIGKQGKVGRKGDKKQSDI